MKHCKNCGINYPNSKNFCEECGRKLTKFVEEKSEKVFKTKVRKKYPKWQWGILGIVSVFSIFLLVYVVTHPITYMGTLGNESKITGRVSQNCYQIQESYTSQVPYTVQVPYTYTYKYTVIDSSLTEDINLELGVFHRGTVKVSNSEDKDGIFVVHFDFRTVDETERKSSSKLIGAHSTETFELIYDSELGQDVRASYVVEPPTETRYTEEVRYREETRYRTVEKCE